MESTREFTVHVRYMGSEGGPCIMSIKVVATTKHHALELALNKGRHIQPNREMYQVLPHGQSKAKMQKMQMKREQQILAGFADCYAMTYN